MGASRINCVLLDLKVHSADTSLQVSRYDGDFFAFSLLLKGFNIFSQLFELREDLGYRKSMELIWYIIVVVDDSMEDQPTFVLRKWASSDNGEHSSEEAKPREDKLHATSDSQQLRNRSGSQLSGMILPLEY